MHSEAYELLGGYSGTAVEIEEVDGIRGGETHSEDGADFADP